MATAVAKLNNKKVAAKATEWLVKSDPYGRISLYHNGASIFSGYINANACCAFNEVSSFSFGLHKKQPTYSAKLQKYFEELVRKCHDKEGGSYQTFVLNKDLGKDKPNQPAWFVKCLENYPGAQALDWTPNYTHSPVNTEVRAYFLPTLYPERLNEAAIARESDPDYEEEFFE